MSDTRSTSKWQLLGNILVFLLGAVLALFGLAAAAAYFFRSSPGDPFQHEDLVVYLAVLSIGASIMLALRYTSRTYLWLSLANVSLWFSLHGLIFWGKRYLAGEPPSAHAVISESVTAIAAAVFCFLAYRNARATSRAFVNRE